MTCLNELYNQDDALVMSFKGLGFYRCRTGLEER